MALKVKETPLEEQKGGNNAPIVETTFVDNGDTVSITISKAALYETAKTITTSKGAEMDLVGIDPKGEFHYVTPEGKRIFVRLSVPGWKKPSVKLESCYAPLPLE